MPEFKLPCPYCGQHLGIPDEMRGQVVDCPTCSNKITIPLPDDSIKTKLFSIEKMPWYMTSLPAVTLILFFGRWRATWGIACGFGIAYVILRFVLDRQVKSTRKRVAEIIAEYNRVDLQQRIGSLSAEVVRLDELKHKCGEEGTRLSDEVNELRIRSAKEALKLKRIKEMYKSIEHCLEKFLEYDPSARQCRIPDVEEADLLAPSVEQKLKSLGMKDLRKSQRENSKQIDQVYAQYEGKYTTKSNKALYALAVVSLRSEIQNILGNMKGENLETVISQVSRAVGRTLHVAGEGNQSIVPTLTKFMGQIEYLFVQSVKLEHMWFVRKEEARQEQIAIRERMREEAKERKELETQMKRMAEEEEKYATEMGRLRAMLEAAEIEEDKAKIHEQMHLIENQSAELAMKREDVARLKNGKAGTVYVISNLGAFGDSVFKVGMTRRLDPQDRIDELSDASVPFEFDVHSFIFSNDAVSLESALHSALDASRLNKVNGRKEFFSVSIDRLEELVQGIDHTAEFTRTMVAEEYRASLSGTIGTPVFSELNEDEEEAETEEVA